MANIARIATWKQSALDKDVSREPVTIVVDGHTIVITRALITRLNTTKKLMDKVEEYALANGIELPPIFFHINRDKSIAIATGQEPEIWPEDDAEE